jgi:hypothetical protein
MKLERPKFAATRISGMRRLALGTMVDVRYLGVGVSNSLFEYIYICIIIPSSSKISQHQSNHSDFYHPFHSTTTQINFEDGSHFKRLVD